jgi:hypothetical protein
MAANQQSASHEIIQSIWPTFDRTVSLGCGVSYILVLMVNCYSQNASVPVDAIVYGSCTCLMSYCLICSESVYDLCSLYLSSYTSCFIQWLICVAVLEFSLFYLCWFQSQRRTIAVVVMPYSKASGEYVGLLTHSSPIMMVVHCHTWNLN